MSAKQAFAPGDYPDRRTRDQRAVERVHVERQIRSLLRVARDDDYRRSVVARLQQRRRANPDHVQIEEVRRPRRMDLLVTQDVVVLRRKTADEKAVAELAERFGPIEENGRELSKAVKLGLLVPVGDGRYEAPSPGLLRAAEEVIARGVPLAAALQVIEKVNRSSRSIAQAFVQLFLDELWKPFDREGRPEERWPEITESIERLRPIASEAVLGVFKQTMTTEVEDAFGKILERQGRDKRDH